MSYLIPAEATMVEQEVKKSRFISAISRAKNREEAMHHIAKIREGFPDARHHCWAFVAGDPHHTVDIGMSDAGEPSGTAGKPMLSVLKHKCIGEVVVVVTRYFGGIKLGSGGLVRAYASSVQQVIDITPFRQHIARKKRRVNFPFQYENSVRNLFASFDVKIASIAYTDQVSMLVALPEKVLEEVEQQLKNRTQGESMMICSTGSMPPINSNGLGENP
ncbi:MAG: YigZ family protein [Mariprofundaceae bacterium]